MFASPGYVVVMINRRGSTGFGQPFTDQIAVDWGGKPFEDLMKGLDFVTSRYPFTDSQRVAAAGASYGGYMIDWLASHSKGRFRTLVSHAGVYNLTSMYGATEELWFPEWDFGGLPWTATATYEKLSPHTYAAEFGTKRRRSSLPASRTIVCRTHKASSSSRHCNDKMCLQGLWSFPMRDIGS
jgi:dipeptidyl aminopeptidase/acylaminoacyl peptidase